MAQTNYTPISLYYSTTASAVPTAANLVPGELAINTNDGKLYYEDSSGVVQVLATKSTGSIGGSNTQVQFNNSGSLGGSSGLTWDGSFLTTSSIKNSALTSGRVTYAGASGLLSDSANLTFSGSALSVIGNITSSTLQLGTNPAGVSIGVLGIPNQKRIYGRNAANNADVSILYVDGSNGLVLGPSDAVSITSGGILTTTLDASVYGLTVGRGAGAISTNTVLGASALASNSTGTLNIAIGANANKTTTGSNNIGIGQYTLGGNAAGATGSSNTGLGDYTMFQLTSGASNVAIGQSSQQFTSTGSYNVSVGNGALLNNSTASNNTAVGYQAAYTGTTATQLVAVGTNALRLNTVNYGTAVGYNALAVNSTGNANAAFGAFALSTNTTGEGNSAFGGFGFGLSDSALQNNSTGNYNSAFGLGALSANTASNNTAVGFKAGTGITSGSSNTYIGYLATQSGVSVTNEIVVGANITGKGSNTAFIGGTSGAYNGANSVNWSIISDVRLKKNVVSLESGLSVISSLRPVEFDYIKDDKHDVGFIAQEYKEVLPKQITEDSEGMLSLNQNLVPYLVKAIQELKAEIDQLKGLK